MHVDWPVLSFHIGYARKFLRFINKCSTISSYFSAPENSHRMKLILKTFPFFLCTLFLISCGNSGEKAEGSQPEQPELPRVLTQGTTQLDLNEHGLPFSLIVPDSMRGIPNIQPTTYGETQIEVGKTYNVVVAEGGDLAAFKSQLKDDLLYKHTIVEEGPDFVLYKSEIADSFLDPEFHFYSVKQVGNRTFEFHDFNEEGGYAESVARFMLESVNHLKPMGRAA